MKSMYVATSYRTVASAAYARRDDKLPYVMAFPLEYVLLAEDRYLKSRGYGEKGSELEPVTFPISSLSDSERAECLSKLRIFSLDS